MSNSRTCYGCEQKLPISEMRYECTCMENKGVCKKCIENKIEFTVPADHLLTKLHDTTAEWDAVWNEIDTKCKGWSCSTMSGENQITIHYREGPNGEKGAEFDDFLMKNNLPLYPIAPEYKKSMTFTLPAKSCTCCS